MIGVIYSVWCDIDKLNLPSTGCHGWAGQCESKQEARTLARELGWRRRRFSGTPLLDLCPRCLGAVAKAIADGKFGQDRRR